MTSWLRLVTSLLIIVNPAFARRIKRHGDEPHSCDDGKHGIEIDLHGESDWKCTENEWRVDGEYRADKRCYNQESAYHVCIDKTIDDLYESDIPHSGPHRKVWAQYGEYNYLPPGRYVHNLEHGGVVFMYHPCAPQKVVERLRKTATTCLYRYIVTAFPKLTKEYPFAVLTYGCMFRMSQVHPDEIKGWIRQQFGKSPEPDVYGNGLYNHGLLVPSIEPGSYDYYDSKPFCPDVPLFGMKDEEITDSVTKEFLTSESDEAAPDSDGDSKTEQEVNIPIGQGNVEEVADSDVTVHWGMESRPENTEEPKEENSVAEAGYIENTFTSDMKGHPEISVSLKEIGSVRNSNLQEKLPSSENPVNDNTEPAAEAGIEKNVPINSDEKASDEDAPSQTSTTSPVITTEFANPGDNIKSQDSSLLFWSFISFACFVIGLLVGVCVMNVRRRRDGMNMKKCKVWSDRDSADSFSIAAVVRKIPNTFTNRKPNDDYHRLEPNDQSSDEDNPI